MFLRHESEHAILIHKFSNCSSRTQSMSRSVNHDPQDAPGAGLLQTLTQHPWLSFFLTPLEPLRPLCFSPSASSQLLSQGLCKYCHLCLESSPKYPHGSLLSFLQVSVQISPHSSLLWCLLWNGLTCPPSLSILAYFIFLHSICYHLK